LRVIATAPTDSQPVIDAIIQSASRLSRSTEVWLHIREADQLCIVAGRATVQHPVRVGDLVPIGAGSVVARTLLERRTIHVPDSSDRSVLGRRTPLSFPSAIAVLTVPLVRGDEAVGVLLVGRDRSEPYSRREIALVETFA